ncbi:3-oxoacyl-ACP synthase [Sorangium cellulosum]|uniref:3-oxoacyl-ACP synthase n=1 Tax=Sorangium cellulosum TaxID=56 RepID=A0A2L0EVV3_SORCE|nr:hypothetical protein [Sorangium cellulosum]AUX43426.1 3-oxoacyl-ACP synthase [Sorangium cellulosum]
MTSLPPRARPGGSPAPAHGVLRPPLAITGLGVATSVGLGAAQTAASVRAGLANLHEHTFFLPTTRDPGWDDDEPLLCGAVPGVDPFLSGPSRLVELAALALQDLVSTSGLRRRDLASAALLVALPGLDDAVRAWGLDALFVPDLLRRAGLAPFPTTRVLHAGQTGMLELAGVAASLLQARTVELCLVLGVDSYLSRDRLDLLDGAYRLRTTRNVDGFLPGEGASVLALEPRSRAEARGAEVLVSLEALGFGDEPRPIGGDRQSSGAGLREALRAVLGADAGGEAAAGGAAPWVFCDLNGESYRCFEWGLMMARFGERLASVRRLVHPADCFGDIGAATAGALLACVAAASRRGYATAREATLFCASDGGRRAAARVTC